MKKYETKEFAFINWYMELDNMYLAYRETSSKPVSKKQFALTFKAWQAYQQATTEADDTRYEFTDDDYNLDEIKERFKGMTFEKMISIDLSGVQKPSQEKDEIMFKMLTEISLILDTSKRNKYFLEYMKQRWRVAQHSEPYLQHI